MLHLENLSFAYRRGTDIVSHMNLRVTPGGIYGLLGPNGAGKSTLLYLMAGALTPASGTVTFNGINTRKRLPSTLGDIFLVSEEFSLPQVSLQKYVDLNAPFYPRFSQENLHQNLEMFGLDPEIHLGALSMGQKKKAFMCFALACNTSLLLMDEPTNGLDIPGKSAFRKFIAGAMTDDRTIIISTHQVRDIDRIIDHVMIMNNSKIEFNRPVWEIQKRLKFINTSNRDIIDHALCAVPGLGGAAVMLPNTDSEDSEINLEVLFDFAMKNPEALQAMFQNNNDTQNH